jgi:hypothetical protein
MLIIKITLQWLRLLRVTFHEGRWITRTFVVTAVILNVNDKFVAHSAKSKLPDVCSWAMNHYVSLLLTNMKFPSTCKLFTAPALH